MQVPAFTSWVRQPFLDLGCLVRGQVVEHYVDLKALRYMQIDVLEKRQHILTGVVLLGVEEHLTGRYVQRREQIGCAVALVVMGFRLGPVSSAATVVSDPTLDTASSHQS